MFQILVVEDDRALCQSVCAYLSGQGYETTGCQSAQDAYDAMYSRVFDLIVSTTTWSSRLSWTSWPCASAR